MTVREIAAERGVESMLGGLDNAIAAYDWSATPVGPRAAWPQSLRTALSICLKSRFPMIIFWGPELVQFYNDAYAPILGAKHPAALGQRARDCWPEIWDSVGPMLYGVLENGVATWSENLYLPLERNGFPEELYFTFSYSPIESDEGIGGVFCAVTETTAIVLRERESRERAEALAELDRTKTAFFDNVSHEFRTPLTLILGPIGDLLLDADLTPKQRAALDSAERNARRLRRLVDTLLEFNRIEAHRVALNAVPCDLAELTNDIASMFDSAAARAGLELRIDVGAFGGPVFIDTRLWEHVVLNLISNSLKYTFDGNVTVRLTHDAERVRLEVSDTGIGIAEKDLPHVFERFWRGEASRARSAEGSGIGLALVHDIAELHGGRVTARSRLGAGTTIAVEVPYRPAPAPAPSSVRENPAARLYEEEALSWTARSDGTPSRDGATPRARLLCIDDNADLRAYIERILGALYDVTTASDGETGLELAARIRPDLILCDVMMPGLSGIETVKRLRALEALRLTPIIVLSAREADDASASGALSAGADGYVAKPFSAQQLLVTVERQLTQARVRAEESARFRAIADHVAHIIYTHDTRGSINWANRRWYEYTGLTGLDALTALGWQEVLPPEDFARFIGVLDRAFTTGEQYEIELRIKPASSTSQDYRWHVLRGLPMRDAHGAITGWAGSATDVHDHRVAKEQLEREFDREHRASLAFQDAALPSRLPDVPGFTFSAVYESAKAEAQVGGDWYDAFRLSDGRIVLSVGDVMGSGLGAAVTMGAVRQAIRGAAQIYPDPAAVLDAAGRALRSEQPDRIVTAFVGVLDPITLVLSFASAGHPMPLLRTSDGEIVELAAQGLPMGLRNDEPRAASVRNSLTIPERSLLVLYTDGLTESTRDVIAGEKRLRAALEDPSVLNASDVARAIRDAVLDAPADDVAILALRIGDVGAALAAHDGGLRTQWIFQAADAAAGTAVRRELAEVLARVGATPGEIGDAQVVLGELIGNVVRHSGGEAEVMLDLSGDAPVIHVMDRGRPFTFHARLPRDPMSESGRGLYIAASLTHDLNVMPRAGGGSHARAVLAVARL